MSSVHSTHRDHGHGLAPVYSALRQPLVTAPRTLAGIAPNCLSFRPHGN